MVLSLKQKQKHRVRQKQRCSTSYLLGNWELKIKTTMRYLLEWLTSKALTTTNAGENVEPQELSLIAGGNTQ